jgi:hypothetical protein
MVLQNLSIASFNSSNLFSSKTKYTIYLSGTAKLSCLEPNVLYDGYNIVVKLNGLFIIIQFIVSACNF